MLIVFNVLYGLRVWHLLLWIESALGWRHHVIVLLFHHIRDDSELLPPLSQVEEGISQTALGNQLRTLVRWYSPIESQEILALFSGRRSLRRDSIYVTFDDGYRDNLTLGSPILYNLRVPATIFLATGFVDTPREFWWLRLNDIVRRMSNGALAQVADRFSRWPQIAQLLVASSIHDHGERRAFRVKVAEQMEQVSDDEKEALLDALDELTEGCSQPSLPLLNWREIQAMEQDGITFGAHTVTHPQLSQLTQDQVQCELEQSAQQIAAHLGERPAEFAYPYGDYSASIEKQVQQAGFQLAYTAAPGVAVPGKTCPTRVARMQIYAAEPARLIGLVVVLKLGKYLPSIARPLLSRIFSEPFEI